MLPEKTTKPKKSKFTDEQICPRAYQISQKYPERSPDENWKAAIQELETESQLLRKFWRWTGFGEKKLWDFLQLLIVPIVLAGTGFALQQFAKQSDQQSAIDKAQQETLVKYLDEMAELLQKGLLKTKTDSDTYIFAQSKTVIALQSLDPKRQHIVIQFIDAANLNSFTLDGKKGILYKARMSKANLNNADLSGAHLSSADLSGARLSGANFSYADLSSASLSDADLSGANLFGTNLESANLGGANLMKANLSLTKLRKAMVGYGQLRFDLSGSKSHRYRLSGTQINAANLSGARLFAADLEDASLAGANLSGAELTSTRLHGANLSGANLDGANLNKAYLCKTIIPSGEDDKISNENCPKNLMPRLRN
jgi:uncharacterized protein YjbI with pentapeptide repeats